MVLIHIHKIFDDLPLRKWSSIPSSWMWAGLSHQLLMNRIRQKWWCVRVDLVIHSTVAFSCSLPDQPFWEKPAALSRGHSSSPMEWSVWWEIEVCRQQPREWAVLKGKSSAQSIIWLHPWPTSWWQPHVSPWARTTQLNCSWIPDLYKLHKIINVCCLKSLSFSR